MARNTTSEERANASVVVLPGEEIPLDDVEAAFDDWRSSFEKGEEPGKVRAFQIPIDERGNPNVNSKTQIRLGSWPIDLYSFDELCQVIIKGWLIPYNEKIMAVRLVGTKSGERGFVFNKIVILRPPAETVNGAAPESTASLLKAFQDMSSATVAQVRSLLPQKPETDAMDELRKIMAFSQMINAPMMKMMETLLPALAGRPAVASADPFASLGGVIDLAGKIADLKSGGDGGGSDSENDWVNILRAVAPIAKSAVEALPHVLQAPRPALAPPTPQVVVPQPSHPLHNPGPGVDPGRPSRPSPAAPSPALTDIPAGDTAMFAQLKPQIDALVTMAKDKADPAAAADILFEQVMLELPEELYGRVAELIAGPNFVKNAAVFNPAVLQFTPFFEAFRAQIIARVEREDAEAGQTPSSAGANAGAASGQ